MNSVERQNARPKKRQRLEPYLVSSSSTVRRITSGLPCEDFTAAKAKAKETSPKSFLQEVLQSRGINMKELSMESLSTGFFLEPTEEHIASYGHDLIQAVRKRDIRALKEVVKKGERSLQCCNQFGESIIHMACRRGFTEVVAFLINEAGVSIRIRDDCGRTPMHDACWTCEPNFELMELLIETDPDLLLVKDRRGHTPFEYVRREHWRSWVDFLDRKRELLLPKELMKTSLPGGSISVLG